MILKRFLSSNFHELSKATLALSISFLSMFTMMFFDRLFLSQYHSEALCVAVEAGTLAWSFFIGWVTVASLVEVFVARYVGEGKESSVGSSIWQGIWFSVLSSLFFIFLGTVGSNILLDLKVLNEKSLDYFKLHMLFSPVIVLTNALSAFYVGKGKAHVVTWMALLGNAVNIILDPLLIFGVSGRVPSLGILGAAIASGAGYLVQAMILISLFLRRKNRVKYQTLSWRFNPYLFAKVIKLGAPSAIFVTLEVSSWAFFFFLMSKVSREHSFVTSVCQSVAFLFFCFGLGLEKASAVVSGKLIGSNRVSDVKTVFKSGLQLILMSSVVIFLIFFCAPQVLFLQFMSQDSMTFSIDTIDGLFLSKGGPVLLFLGIYLVFEYVRYLLNGILSSAGDTFFLMVAGVLSILGFFVLPSYLLVYKGHAKVEVALAIWSSYSIFASLILYLRFYSKKWMQKRILSKV